MRKTKADSTHANADVATLTYEEAQHALQQLLSEVESQQIPLDKLLATFTRGQALLAHCRSKLAALEQQIQLLDDQAGVPS